MPSALTQRRRSARRALASRPFTWRGQVVPVAIALLFLAFASFVSWMAPVHVLILQRQGGTVRADATRQLLLVFPLGTRTVFDVREASTSTYQAPTETEPGRRGESGSREVRPEAVGTLALRGSHTSADVLVSPHDLEDARRRVHDFLAGAEPRLRLHLVSNWKFGVFVVALVALPGVLVVLAVVWEAGKAAGRWLTGHHARPASS